MNKPSIRLRSTIKWIAASFVAAVVVLLIVSWILFQHIPSWYRPPRVPAEKLQSVRDNWLATIELFRGALNQDHPFTFTLRQDQLNTWLAVSKQITGSPWVPPHIEDPFVRFESDGVTIAGTVTIRGVRTVLNASINVGVEQNRIAVQIDTIRGGSLGIPGFWVRNCLEPLKLREHNPYMPRPVELLTGAFLPAEYEITNPKRRFRIRDIRLESGEIIVEIEPLPRYTGS